MWLGGLDFSHGVKRNPARLFTSENHGGGHTCLLRAKSDLQLRFSLEQHSDFFVFGLTIED